MHCDAMLRLQLLLPHSERLVGRLQSPAGGDGLTGWLPLFELNSATRAHAKSLIRLYAMQGGTWLCSTFDELCTSHVINPVFPFRNGSESRVAFWRLVFRELKDGGGSFFPKCPRNILLHNDTQHKYVTQLNDVNFTQGHYRKIVNNRRCCRKLAVRVRLKNERVSTLMARSLHKQIGGFAYAS